MRVLLAALLPLTLASSAPALLARIPTPLAPCGVGTIPAGPGAYVAHRAFRSMWVTSFAGADVRRFAP
jgi:hypothetical protein